MEALKISQEKTQENQSSQRSYPNTDDQKRCAKHGLYNAYYTAISGKVWEIKECPDCKDERIREKERAEIEKEKQSRISSLLVKSNIPKRFKSLDINLINNSYHKKAEDNEKLKKTIQVVKAYLATYPERLKKGASGFFSGECGTGKTMLACMMVENIINQGYSAQYTTAWQMIQDIRQGYGKIEESISYFINEYINKSFLVIDEVGVQHGTDDERILLYQVIDGRYNEVKPTIIISNSKNPVEDGYLDLRTIDRLKEGGGFSITFDGESYRK